MYFTIANKIFWDDYAALSNLLSEELRFWRYNLSAFNCYSIRRKLSFDYVIFTDASDHACFNMEVLSVKPSLHIVGRIVSLCWRPCPKGHITAL